jgi:uncharacterized membrane protein YkvA (DUF1232 family)
VENRQIDFVAPKAFPIAMLDFRQYDGAKAFALLIFCLACIYFASGLKNIFMWEDSWWKPDTVMQITYFLYHLLVFTIVYCLTWLVFDKRGIEGYALALFSTLLGIIYVLSPVDFIPEAIPLAGSLDDVIIGVGYVMVGMKGYYNSKNKIDVDQHMLELIEEGKNDDAIRFFVKRHGYCIRNIKSK